MLLIADPQTQEEPREEAHERLHALVTARAEEDHWAEPRRPQRRDLQEPRQEVEVAARGREAGVHWRGGATAAAAPQGVPRLQVQTKEEGQVPAGRRQADQRGLQAAPQAEELSSAVLQVWASQAAHRGEGGRRAAAGQVQEADTDHQEVRLRHPAPAGPGQGAQQPARLLPEQGPQQPHPQPSRFNLLLRW